jgi:hypothetical protein
MAAAGYSGAPLAKKLGLKPRLSAWFHAMPDTVWREIGPIGLTEHPGPVAGLDVAHVFVTERSELEKLLGQLRETIAPDGMVWVSWPKKASKVPTDISEQTIRDVALPLGLVDVKVCAVDETWSGLKLVIRKALR